MKDCRLVPNIWRDAYHVDPILWGIPVISRLRGIWILSMFSTQSLTHARSTAAKPWLFIMCESFDFRL